MIAERRLMLITDDGEARDILVRIGKPEPNPDHGDFSCKCQILGFGDSKVHRIYGLDGFQALRLTLRFISTMLNHYRQEAKGRIYWEHPGDDMGFGDPQRSE